MSAKTTKGFVGFFLVSAVLLFFSVYAGILLGTMYAAFKVIVSVLI